MDKILGYVELGQKQGATLLSGGRRHGKKGFFVEPTVFDNVKDDMGIAKDEIFGPVVSVLPFKSVEEVVERANNTSYGLAAAVWTKNIDKAHLFAKQVKAGTGWVNCYHVVDTTTSYGGDVDSLPRPPVQVKRRGRHEDGIRDGLRGGRVSPLGLRPAQANNKFNNPSRLPSTGGATPSLV